MNIVRIATIPKVMGMERSDMGMHASSEITNVITSSKGSISPIWRLPISLIENSNTAKRIIALMKIITILLVCCRSAKICKDGFVLKKRSFGTHEHPVEMHRNGVLAHIYAVFEKNAL